MEPMGWGGVGMYFCRMYFCRKVDPLGDSIRRFPSPLGGAGRIFVQQRLIPELPGAAGAFPWGEGQKVLIKPK